MEAHPGWLYLRKETEEASGGRRRTREGDAGVSVYGGSFSFRVICGSLVVRIDAASRPITIHRTTITPLGYIPTRRILVSPSYALSISPSHVRVPSSLRPRLPLRRPSSSIPALLQIARRTYPLRLRKIARDLNYYALLFFLSLSLLLLLFSCSNYYLLFHRSRFKLSRELRIIIYWLLAYRIYSGRHFFHNFKRRCEMRGSPLPSLCLSLSLFFLLSFVVLFLQPSFRLGRSPEIFIRNLLRCSSIYLYVCVRALRSAAVLFFVGSEKKKTVRLCSSLLFDYLGSALDLHRGAL